MRELSGSNSLIPCPCAPEYDLSNPLEFAINKLKAIAEEQSRTFDMSNYDSLTPQQKIQDKNAVKWQLRNYDLAFQARYGHLVCFFSIFLIILNILLCNNGLGKNKIDTAIISTS